ncbi:hypothetical protein DV735_g2818, partial [Chaetothyriales sp. CBS 134920]
MATVTLTRAFLGPVASVPRCVGLGVGAARSVSNWAPRERFAQTKRIDKLHRKQKADNRIERQESEKRAQTIVPPSSIPSATATTTTTASSSSPSSASATPLPYFIHRTRSLNIPVYESAKAGGSKHVTTLRKCAGDLEALRTHILEALKLEPSFVDPRGQKKQNVVINKLTNQLVIRGWRGAEVKEWCRLAGF